MNVSLGDLYVYGGLHFPTAGGEVSYTIGKRLARHEEFFRVMHGKRVLFLVPVLAGNDKHLEKLKEEEKVMNQAIASAPDSIGWAGLVKHVKKKLRGLRFAPLEKAADVR